MGEPMPYGNYYSLTNKRIMKNIEIIMDLDFTLDYIDYLYGESLSA